VKQGYKYLTEIETILKKCKSKPSTKDKDDLMKLSSKFFTFIPHNFGRLHAGQFVINTMDKLREKLDLIQSLVDINVAFKACERADKTP